MTIKQNQENEKLTLTLAGKLDTTTAPQLQEVLIPAFDENEEIKLDFSSLTLITSAGLRVLLLGQKTANAKGIPMAIGGVSDEIMEIFEMTGFKSKLTIV